MLKIQKNPCPEGLTIRVEMEAEMLEKYAHNDMGAELRNLSQLKGNHRQL